MSRGRPRSRLWKSVALVISLLAVALVLLSLASVTDLPLRGLAGVIGGLGGACIGFVILFALEDRQPRS